MSFWPKPMLFLVSIDKKSVRKHKFPMVCYYKHLLAEAECHVSIELNDNALLKGQNCVGMGVDSRWIQGG